MSSIRLKSKSAKVSSSGSLKTQPDIACETFMDGQRAVTSRGQLLRFRWFTQSRLDVLSHPRCVQFPTSITIVFSAKSPCTSQKINQYGRWWGYQFTNWNRTCDCLLGPCKVTRHNLRTYKFYWKKTTTLGLASSEWRNSEVRKICPHLAIYSLIISRQ